MTPFVLLTSLLIGGAIALTALGLSSLILAGRRAPRD